jgi:hypothetical protein
MQDLNLLAPMFIRDQLSGTVLITQNERLIQTHLIHLSKTLKNPSSGSELPTVTKFNATGASAFAELINRIR